MLLFLNLLPCFIYLCDCVTITVIEPSDVTDVWQYDCDITQTLTLDLKIENKLKIKLKWKIKLKETQVQI